MSWPAANLISAYAMAAVPLGPPAPAAASDSDPSDPIATTGVRNAADSPACPEDGALANATPVPSAVCPDPNGPFIVTAQATDWPLTSVAANPVAPRSRGRLAILNLSSVALVAVATDDVRFSADATLPCASTSCDNSPSANAPEPRLLGEK